MDYAAKRSFDATPEPVPEVSGDVDPTVAPAGETFVIHQHHARRLHFDLRLEMLNGAVPVLVSWAVPKNLPLEKGERTLAIHVEDHPFEYGSFSGSIPKGNYGAGEVRIFDSGAYEMLERKPGKITFRLNGERMRGTWHLVKTREVDGKQQWLAILKEWEGPSPDPMPEVAPMVGTPHEKIFDDPRFAFEPAWKGTRTIAVCDKTTALHSRSGADVTPRFPKLKKVNEQLVAINAMVDGVAATGEPAAFVAFDLLYLDGRSLVGEPYEQRRRLLEQTVVAADFLQVSPSIAGEGTSLLAAAAAQGLPGVIAKKVSSLYYPGQTSEEWLQIASGS